MSAPYDHVVCLGRFAPVHHGHVAALQRALELGKRVLALVGSGDAPASARDPWSYAQRAVMVRAAVGEASDRLIVRPLPDHLYDELAWTAEVQATVADALGPDAGRVALLGRSGGDAWRAGFPQWASVDVAPVEAPSAEALRKLTFENDGEGLRPVVPPAVFNLVQAGRATEGFARGLEEWRHIREYQASWAAAPYPPSFVTADVVIVWSGHVLLVERKGQPGRGLWALPGGFVDPHETTLQAALRELREETGFDLPDARLLAALAGREAFDRPDRSLRGRTVTHAACFLFPEGPPPPVAGGDDAAQARWVPLAEAKGMRGRMFEDHFHILERMLGPNWSA